MPRLQLNLAQHEVGEPVHTDKRAAEAMTGFQRGSGEAAVDDYRARVAATRIPRSQGLVDRGAGDVLALAVGLDGNAAVAEGGRRPLQLHLRG